MTATLMLSLLATAASAQGEGQFVPPHSDLGVDTDGDTLFNLVRVNVNVDATVPGSFFLIAELLDITGTMFIDIQFVMPTLTGPATIPVDFGGATIRRSGIPGPYLVNLTLYDDFFNLDDTDLYTTNPYTLDQFDPPPALLAPPHADAVEDRDVPPDGLYNVLRVDVGVNVTEGGGYVVYGTMFDLANTTVIAQEYVTAALGAGMSTVPLYFPGVSIRSSGIDGPYFVDLELDAFEGGMPVMADRGNHTTAAYPANGFQAANATLSGFVTDAVSGLPLDMAFLDVYNYRDDVHLMTYPDLLGFYSFDLYDGDWILTGDEWDHQSELFRVRVTGPATTQNVDLPPVAATPIAGDLALATWDDLALAYDYAFVGDNRTFRISVDWYYGNRDEMASQAEVDVMMAGFAGPGLVESDTSASFRTDGIFYDLVPGTYSITWSGAPGPIDSTVVPQAVEAGTYVSNATIAPGPVHAMNLTAYWDQGSSSFAYALALPPGFVLMSHDAPPEVTVTGMGTGSVTVDPGLDPNPMDPAYTVSIALVAGVPDAEAPVIASAAASPDPVGIGGSTTITATVTDNQAVAGVLVEVRDPFGVVVANASMPNVGGDDFAYVFTPADLGLHTFTVWAWDGAGNIASRPGQFLVADLAPPVVSGVSATPDAQEYGGSVVLFANVTDNVAVAVVAANVTDPSGGDLGNFTMAYNATSARYETVQTFLELGTLTCVVWASDAAGNVASAPGSFRIEDTTAPAVAGTSAVPDPVELGSAVTISAQATDLAGVASVTVEIRDPSGAPVGNFTMTDAGGGTYTYAFTGTVVGAHTYRVFATDASGNTASAPGGFAVVDTTPPTLTGTGAAPDPAELGASVTITAHASDLSGSLTVTVEVHDPTGALVGNFTMTGVGGDTYTYALGASLLGTYAFTVTAVDASSNAAVALDSFLVQDTTDPVADAGPGQTVPAGTTVTFNGSASTDNDRVDSYAWNFTVSGSPVTLTGATPTYTFATPGTYVVTLTVRDPSGNEGTDTVTIVVQAPTGSIVGNVTDEDGGAIAGATVRLLRGSTVVDNATTDANGRFTFADLEPGSYTVEAEASGYRSASETVNVVAGSAATVTLELARVPPPKPVDWVPFAVLAVVIVLVLVALLLWWWRRRASKAPEEPKPEAEETEEVEEKT